MYFLGITTYRSIFPKTPGFPIKPVTYRQYFIHFKKFPLQKKASNTSSLPIHNTLKTLSNDNLLWWYYELYDVV